MQLTAPSVGLPWLPKFAADIVRLFKSVMDAPFRLWPVATASLPPAADFKGGLVWDATAGTIKYSDGTNWNTFQLSDAQLDAIAGLTPAADQIIYWTGPTAAAMTGLTAFARTILDDANQAAVQATIGYTAADVLTKLLTVDGAASLLDADKLDGQEGIFYLARANHTGTQAAATISDFSTAADARVAAAVGVSVQAFDATLSAFAAYNTNGLLTQTAADTFTGRTLTGPAAGITVANGNGVSGNPTLALANDLAALEALSGTNTIYYRSASDTWTAVTIGAAITFSGGALNVGAATGTTGTGNVVLSASPTLTGTVTLAAISASGNVTLDGGIVAVQGDAGTQGGVRLTRSTGNGLVDIRDAANAQQGFFGGLTGTRLRLVANNSATGIRAECPTDFLAVIAGTTRMTVNATGADVVGEVRGDSLRIDVAPTVAAAVVSTHKLAFSANGTTYYFLLTNV